MIKVENIEKSFFERLLYKDVNIEINAGDKVAIIGENGSGKSTFLKIILGDEPIEQGNIIVDEQYKITYFDQFGFIDNQMSVQEVLDIAFSAVIEKSSQLSLLEAKMGETDDLEQVLEDYAVCMEEFDALGGYEYLNEQNKFIQIFELSDILATKYENLSGGERQYLRLALALFNDSDLIILDEPLSFFDAAKANWLTSFIKDSSKTFIVISHQTNFIAKFANKILDFDNLTIKQYDCQYEQYLKAKVIYLKELELANAERNEIINEKQKTVDKATIWMDTSSNAHRIALMIKRLEREIEDLEDKMSVFLDDKLYDFKLENNRNQDQEVFTMVKFENVNLSYDSKVIFKNLNFSLNSDEVISIVGSNGSGKTTFFKLIMQIINPDSGLIEIDPKTKPIFIPQEISYENDRMTVFEYVKHISGLGDEYAISAILRLFDNDDEYIKKRVFTLSGGEQKRLQIYTHMVGESNLMLIDEPTTFMDEYTKIKILELIKEYQGAVILITHEKKVRDMLNVTTYNLIDKKLDLFRKEMN